MSSSDQRSVLEEERRERSIERGANIVDLAQSLQQGRIPSNQQLKRVIAQGKASIEDMIQEGERKGEIFPETVNVLESGKNILTDGQLFLDLKNRDEKFQRFLSHSIALTQELNAQDRPRLRRAARHMQAMQERHEQEYSLEQKEQYLTFLNNARTVIKQLVLSADFRTLVTDLVEVLRLFFQFGMDNLPEALEKGMEAVNVAAEKVGEGIKEGDVKPALADLAASVKQQVSGEPQQQQQQQQQQSKREEKQPERKQQVQQPPQQWESYTQPQPLLKETSISIGSPFVTSYTATPQGHLPIYTQTVQQPIITEIEVSATSQPRESKIDQAADLAKAEGEKLLEQLWAILDKLSRHREWDLAFRSLVSLIDSVSDEVQDVVDTVQTVNRDLETIYESYPAQELAIETIAIIEEFTGKGSWEPFIKYLRQFVQHVRKDKESAVFASDVRSWLYGIIDNPTSIRTHASQNEALALLERGRGIAEKFRWAYHTQDLFDQLAKMAQNIGNDPWVQRVIKDTKRFFESLTAASAGGNIVIVDQMKDVLIPLLSEQLRYIPIPTVTGTADMTLGKFDYELDNIVFSGSEIAPEHIEIRLDNNVDFNLKYLHTNKTKSTLAVRIRNINTHLHNVRFAYRRVSAPHIQDAGLANIDLAGSGAEMFFAVEVHPQGTIATGGVFKVRQIGCKVHNMDIHLHDTKMDWVYNMLTSLFSGSIKRNIEKKVETQMEAIFETINLRLNDLIRLMPSAESITQTITGTPATATTGGLAYVIGEKEKPHTHTSHFSEPLPHERQSPIAVGYTAAAPSHSNVPHHAHVPHMTLGKDPDTVAMSATIAEEGVEGANI